MPQIKLLEKNICEQIAAGEVVERPASVVKELCENSIDAGATKIEIELVKNGLERIRVTDNGCGIDRDDIKTAFLRHATSKIASQEDLQHIGTLGFRGEALAAIASVSKVRIVTRTTASNDGVSMTLVGGDESSFDDIGAPTGTSIYVDSLFFNVPARMKFLKKDTAEGNAVQSVVEQLALTYPYISFKLFRDGRAAFVSPGSGDLYSAIFCVLPREISQDMIELQADSERDIKVTGFITRPQSSKPSRTHQYVSVNGRYIKSRSCCAAAEEACRTYVMSGRFPSFIINVDMPLSDIDVNVHPAKTEVRFKNDRDVFSAVYASVKLAVSLFASNITGVLKRHDEIDKSAETKSDYYEVKDYADAPSKNESTTDGESRELTAFFDIKTAVQESNEPYFMQTNLSQQTATYDNNEVPAAENTSCGAKDCDRTCGDEFDIRILGEAFETYIFAQLGDSVVVIDKHAAHERILFEKLRKNTDSIPRQILLEPALVSLPRDDVAVLEERREAVEKIGFVFDVFGDSSIAVREAPTYLGQHEVEPVIIDVAKKLTSFASVRIPDELENLLHSVACKAAIKAGTKTSEAELESLACDIINGRTPKFCPHGRPVLFIVSRKELEKKFGRA